MKKYILSIDQGTTSSRIVLYNLKFQVLDIIQKEFKQYFPKDGWVEHDAMEIWLDVKSLIKKILKKNKINSSHIVSIGITNQRETTIIWDRATGVPVFNAIVWQDRRTADICEELTAQGKSDIFTQKTGLVVDAYFSATKIKWILDQDHTLRESRGHRVRGS